MVPPPIAWLGTHGITPTTGAEAALRRSASELTFRLIVSNATTPSAISMKPISPAAAVAIICFFKSFCVGWEAFCSTRTRGGDCSSICVSRYCRTSDESVVACAQMNVSMYTRSPVAVIRPMPSAANVTGSIMASIAQITSSRARSSPKYSARGRKAGRIPLGMKVPRNLPSEPSPWNW